ncbi:MAG: phosphatase PAP2 family protein [Bacteroidota bacterium]
MTEFLAFDAYLFELINGHWHYGFLDQLMPFWRSKYLWFPLYLFILIFVWINFRRKSLWFLLAMIASIACADLVSSHLIKKNVQRPRPCHDEQLRARMYLLVPCGGGYSFTSSHATNHFAIAVFLILTLVRRKPRLRWLLFFWAASIAYGQVYVGVHYPSDIVVGALLGTLIAFLGASLLKSSGRSIVLP